MKNVIKNKLLSLMVLALVGTTVSLSAAFRAPVIVIDKASQEDYSAQMAHAFDAIPLNATDFHNRKPGRVIGRGVAQGNLNLMAGEVEDGVLNEHTDVHGYPSMWAYRFGQAVDALRQANNVIYTTQYGIPALFQGFAAMIEHAQRDGLLESLTPAEKKELIVALHSLLNYVVENLLDKGLAIQGSFKTTYTAYPARKEADRAAWKRACLEAKERVSQAVSGEEVIIPVDTTGFSAATAPHRAITVDAAAYAKADKIISETLAEKPSYSVTTRIAAALGGATATAAAAWALQAMIAYATTGSPVA